MSRLARLLTITFAESFATILIERGLYFYTHERLDFTDTENLWLALGFGAAYAVGALLSHTVSRRLPERSILLLVIVGLFLVHATLCVWAGSVAVAVLNTVIGFLSGLKWPVVESCVSAGRTPSAQAKTVGRFNLAWASANPLALVAAGLLIGWRPEGLFAAAGALNLVSLVLVWPLERRPVHLPLDHPERPTPSQLGRYRGLLTSSRWSMMTSYSLMWILAALLPGVFARLGVGVRAAAAMSGVLDVVRLLAFLVLQFWVGWHSRRGPLVWVIAGLPVGFFMTLFAPNLPTLLVGELIFGASAGVTYYAALYYAMVVKNASVDAGGAHEGLIGVGFTLGPVAGLVGRALAPSIGGLVVGMMAGTGVVILAGGIGAARSLLKMRGTPREGPQGPDDG